MSEKYPQRDLLNACESGDIDAARQALENGASINPKGAGWNPNFPPLAEAAKNGHEALCTFLMAQGAKLETPDAWEFLLRSGCPTVTLAPILKGIDYANTKAPDGDGWGIFFADLSRKHPGLIDQVNEHCPDPSLIWNILGENSESPLTVLIKGMGNKDVGAEKIASHMKKLDPEAIVNAAVNGNPALAAMLAIGGNPNAYSDCRHTALHAASCNHQTDAIEQLAAAGARLEARDDKGKTPLMEAGKLDVIETFARLGANFNAHDVSGVPAMHHLVNNVMKFFNRGTPVDERVAQLNRLLEICKDQGIDLSCRSASGANIMHVMARSFCDSAELEAIQTAVGDASLINQGNLLGTTPLMLARTAEVRAALLRLGADIDDVDASGCTALMLAAKGSHVLTSIDLIVNGADTSPVDHNGFNAMDYAIATNNEADMISIFRAVDVKPVFHDQWGSLNLSKTAEARLRHGPLTALMTLQNQRLMQHYLQGLDESPDKAPDPADLKRAQALSSKKPSECGALLNSWLARNAIAKIAQQNCPSRMLGKLA